MTRLEELQLEVKAANSHRRVAWQDHEQALTIVRLKKEALAKEELRLKTIEQLEIQLKKLRNQNDHNN